MMMGSAGEDQKAYGWLLHVLQCIFVFQIVYVVVKNRMTD